VQLPFEILFEPPTLARLRTAAKIAVAATAITGVVGIAVLGSAAQVRTAGQPQSTETGILEITGVPDGAVVEEDGRYLGRAPGSLYVPPGIHQIIVRADGYSAATYEINVEPGESVRLDAELWLQNATGQQLRSPLPGATIANATFLANGDLALLLTLPSTTERQLWVLGRNRQPEHVGPTRADGPMAMSPDGFRVAYLTPSQGSRSTDGRLEEVWISARRGGEISRAWVLPTSRRNEALVDVSWGPDSQDLLLVSRQQGAVGGTRSHFLWLTAGQTEPTEILVLPGDIVPGSYVWAPDSSRVGFLVRNQQATSLCLLGTTDGDFRYLGDVRRTESASLPFSPIDWSPDGSSFVYAALAATQPSNGWWTFGDATRTALFLGTLSSPQPKSLGKAQGQSPAWRSDRGVVALAHTQANRPLDVELMDAQGGVSSLSSLPLGPGSGYAARWDLAHTQALIAIRSSANASGPRTDYWLVRFRKEAQP